MIQGVVVRDERPRERAAGDRLHHRRLDFQESAGVEEPADGCDDSRPRLEHLPRIRIDDEIEIALPVPRLDVRQPVPLLRKWQQSLDEKLETLGPDRELFGLRPEDPPFDADVVAEIDVRDI